MTDLDIAKSVKPLHINEIAEKLGIDHNQLEHYGKYKAKLTLESIDQYKVKKSKLILVSAISPTLAVEGNPVLLLFANPLWDLYLVSRVAQQVVVKLKFYPWRTLTCILQATFQP